VPEHLDTGGPIEGVQLWINLAKAHKGSAPGFTDLQPESMPWQDFPGGRLRALAGTWAGVTGPARSPTAIAYAHLELEAGGSFQQALAPHWVAAVVPLHGAVHLEGVTVPPDTVALLGPGDTLAVSATAAASVMLLAGEPQGEANVNHGPFVMNTREEIEQTLLDYQNGRMGRLD